jgi:hypothetical protein
MQNRTWLPQDVEQGCLDHISDKAEDAIVMSPAMGLNLFSNLYVEELPH